MRPERWLSELKVFHFFSSKNTWIGTVCNTDSTHKTQSQTAVPITLNENKTLKTQYCKLTTCKLQEAYFNLCDRVCCPLIRAWKTQKQSNYKFLIVIVIQWLESTGSSLVIHQQQQQQFSQWCGSLRRPCWRCTNLVAISLTFCTPLDCIYLLKRLIIKIGLWVIRNKSLVVTGHLSRPLGSCKFFRAVYQNSKSSRRPKLLMC